MVIGVIAGVVVGVAAACLLWLSRKKPVASRPVPMMALRTTQPSGERPVVSATPVCARCGGKLEQRDGRWFCARDQQFL